LHAPGTWQLIIAVMVVFSQTSDRSVQPICCDRYQNEINSNTELGTMWGFEALSIYRKIE
jgi:hypothetical protein